AGPGSLRTISGVSDQVIAKGVQLEKSRQWLDAIEFYEKELKQFPESQDLKFGLRRSKYHFAIDRRYSDSSFLRQMLPLSRASALQIVNEVLTNIQRNYVEALPEMHYVAHGTESLFLALSNPKFLKTNLPGISPQNVQKVRTVLKDRYWNKPIEDRRATFRVINEVCDLAEAELGLQSGAVVMEYLFGGCNSLDDYSSYLTPTRLTDLQGNIKGQFVGLGIEMKAESGKGLLLVNVLPESPAAEGGLYSGEHIVGIDGTSCRLMTTDEAANMLQGLPGTRVRLEIENKELKIRDRTFARRPVHVKSIPIVKIIDQPRGIGYIKMTGFQNTSNEEMGAALQSLQAKGMKALIWDLRGNPGGLLTAAVEVLDHFISDGTLVSTKGRTSDQNWTYSAHRTGTINTPLVLLVDGDSASASEIVAGAVRDHRRGVIVGRKTYGKWSVQSIFTLNNGAGLRLTTAKFYSPRGETLGKIGVAPNITVEESSPHRTYFRAPTDVNIEDDLDLQKGLEVLRKQVQTAQQ
ncbi:MAG: carboxyl-terminal protease, partial [Planctomycetaceae bacterium]|nr:carboxyl-terminal protease [Planctomycetaceae bacterium]